MVLDIIIVVLTGLLAAAALATTNDGSRAAALDDAAGIQGNWACAAAVIDGKPLDGKVTAKLKLVMTAERYRTERGDDEVLFDSTYRLDTGHDPKRIEMTGTEGAAAGKPALGIYSLDGDTLRICYTMPGAERPKGFESKTGSKAFLATWTRVGK